MIYVEAGARFNIETKGAYWMNQGEMPSKVEEANDNLYDFHACTERTVSSLKKKGGRAQSKSSKLKSFRRVFVLESTFNGSF